MGYDFRLWTDEDLKEELLNPEIEKWFIKEILRELIKRDELIPEGEGDCTLPTSVFMNLTI